MDLTFSSHPCKDKPCTVQLQQDSCTLHLAAVKPCCQVRRKWFNRIKYTEYQNTWSKAEIVWCFQAWLQRKKLWFAGYLLSTPLLFSRLVQLSLSVHQNLLPVTLFMVTLGENWHWGGKHTWKYLLGKSNRYLSSSPKFPIHRSHIGLFSIGSICNCSQFVISKRSWVLAEV